MTTRWAGFIDAVNDHPDEWSERGFQKEDKSILRLIDDVSEGHEAPDALRPVLTAWIVRRRGVRG